MNITDFYFRNRSREAIVDLLRVVCQLQALNGFKNSEILKAFHSVAREQGNALLGAYLFYIAQEFHRQEMRKRQPPP
jgi:hypothetical protein